jgi:cardiolipin synthase (CMP-forming)
MAKVSDYTLTWSTFFTLIRIILVPFIVLLLYQHRWLETLLLFCCAALTDIIDGALARFLNEKTLLGTYLDPLADKFLIISCFATFSALHIPQLKIPHWFIGLMGIKELLLLLGAWYCIKNNPLLVKPLFWGKLTMAVQSISIVLFLVGLLFNGFPAYVFDLLIVFISFLMIISLLNYAYIMRGCLCIKN